MSILSDVAKALAPKAWMWHGKIGDNVAQENRRTASRKHAHLAIASFQNSLAAHGYKIVPVEVLDGLFEAIKHGDEQHQMWLKAKLDAYFSAGPQLDIDGEGK